MREREEIHRQRIVIKGGKKEREADFNGNFNERNAKHILS